MEADKCVSGDMSNLIVSLNPLEIEMNHLFTHLLHIQTFNGHMLCIQSCQLKRDREIIIALGTSGFSERLAYD